MGVPGQSNVSQTARLILGGPSYSIGWQEPIYVAQPAAGQTWQHMVSGRYWERLLTVRYVFQASAVVLSRNIRMTLVDQNGTAVIMTPGGQNIAANGRLVAELMHNAPVNATGASGDAIGFLPDILIPPGWSWQAQTSPIDAGDQFSGIVLLVQRYPSDTTQILAGE